MDGLTLRDIVEMGHTPLRQGFLEDDSAVFNLHAQAARWEESRDILRRCACSKGCDSVDRYRRSGGGDADWLRLRGGPKTAIAAGEEEEGDQLVYGVGIATERQREVRGRRHQVLCLCGQ